MKLRIDKFRSIDSFWDIDDIVYYCCESKDKKLIECLCYHNGHKFIVFYPDDFALSQLKLAENGLVIIKTNYKKEYIQNFPSLPYVSSFVANIWYKNGKIHNEFGPAISCCYGYDQYKSWSFAWFINDKHWKAIKYQSAKRSKLICGPEDEWRYFTFNNEKHLVKNLWEDFHGKIPIN